MKQLVAILLLAAASTADAATAHLINCTMSFSVTGQVVYVGTYQYGSTVFERAFPRSVGYCPYTVEVY